MNIEIENLYFSYGDGKNIFSDLNLTIEEGTFLCVLGESGCGKSTLLRLVAGLETADKGKILFNESVKQKPDLTRGVVFQDGGLFPWLSTYDNLSLAIKQAHPNVEKKEIKKKMVKSLEQVGLSENIIDKFPHELSGGMQQRVSIARALSIQSPVLLMDEPFGSVDEITRENLQNLILDIWEEQNHIKTVMFITHDVDEALRLSSNVIVLGQPPNGIVYNYLNNLEKNPEFEKTKEFVEVRNTLVNILYENK